jgi:hypothetical protein
MRYVGFWCKGGGDSASLTGESTGKRCTRSDEANIADQVETPTKSDHTFNPIHLRPLSSRYSI